MSQVSSPLGNGGADTLNFGDAVSGAGSTSKNSGWILAALSLGLVLVVWLLNRKK